MNKIKILIVEDETIVALDIKSAIKRLGFEVTNIVANYDDAINSVKKNEPDVILMDINLRNSKDGIETAYDIQKIKNIPIIYLTAYSDDDMINRAIATNPVAYLLKPFKIKELKSTIHLGLYKVNQQNQIIIDNDCTPLGFDYYYDLKNENLYYQNRPIKLSIRESMLLTVLVEARGAIVPFSVLEYAIWSAEPVSNSALRTLIYRLRARLNYKLIETTISFGCKLTPKI
ncbi:MAG: response regulator [Arcobacteraceae bacterium]|nr:response regulator [Arcobacteraceae bacterium]